MAENYGLLGLAAGFFALHVLTSITLRLVSKKHAAVLRRTLDSEIEAETPNDPDALLDLLASRDPHRTEELAARLTRSLRDVLERFSPATAIDELDASLFILQSKKDDAVGRGRAAAPSGRRFAPRIG